MKKSSPSPVLNMLTRPTALAVAAAVIVLGLYGIGSLLSLGLGEYYMRIVMLSGIAIILAVSLNMVNGFAGQFSLGHAGFYMIGAYSSGALTKFGGAAIISWTTSALHVPLSIATTLLMLLAIALGAVTAAGAGFLVGLPSLRLRGDYLAIATLGFGEAIRVIIQNSEPLGAQRGLYITGLYTSFPLLFAFVLLVIIFSRNLALSSHGRALFAIRDDEIAAESAGVNVFSYKLKVFAISAAWAGIAGALYAHFDGYLDPGSFGFMKSVEIVVMVVLGGSGSITGSVVAAIALTSLPILLQNSLPGNLQNIRTVVYAILLVILMLTRPQGIFGRAEFSFRRRKTVVPPAVRGVAP